MPRKEKNFDYQLDLTPFISLLSVCICFLLLTVAWFQVGALSVKQTVGAKSQDDTGESQASLFIYIKAQNKIEVQLKKSGKALSQKSILPSAGALSLNFKEFKSYISHLKKSRPDIDSAFIFPEEMALYEDIVKIMDGVRQAGVFNMGLSPI